MTRTVMSSGILVMALGMVVTGGVEGQEATRAMMTGSEAGVLDERTRAVHLLQRATFGPRPEDIQELLEMGMDAWLDRQLHPELIADPAVAAVADAFPGATTPVSSLLQQYPPGQLTQPLRLLSQDETLSDEDRARIREQLRGTNSNVLINDLVGARLYRSAYSERQLEEVMTQFWFDHFNVFFRKNQVSYLTADYEATAIRPNVFGSFYDLLEATAAHPAMLYYLDNAQSVAPDASLDAIRLAQLSSQFGNLGVRTGRGAGSGRGSGGTAFPRRTGAGGTLGAGATYEEMLLDSLRILRDQQTRATRQGRGLNENYARELLELHTLGVDGGYTQDDIIQVARAFTGWGVTPVNLGNPQIAGAQMMAAGGRAGRGQQAIGLQRSGRGQQAAARQRGPEAQRVRAAELRAAALAGTLDLRELTANLDFSDSYQFEFRASQHDAKEKLVLGHTIAAGGGMEDGLAVLEIVANHPSTARFIASQLAKRFVSDDPPESLVARLEAVFIETGGDLSEVTRTLFTAEEFYAPEIINSRVKSPFTLLASAVRLTGAEILAVRPVIQKLTTLGEVPYMADAPTGYPQESAVWVSSGAMLNRMNLGIDLASGRFRGIRLNNRRSAQTGGQSGGNTIERLVARLLPGADTEQLIMTLREELADDSMASPRERSAAILGLILGSPQFQRH